MERCARYGTPIVREPSLLTTVAAVPVTWTVLGFESLVFLIK